MINDLHQLPLSRGIQGRFQTGLGYLGDVSSPAVAVRQTLYVGFPDDIAACCSLKD
jgi:hypothetical protein